MSDERRRPALAGGELPRHPIGFLLALVRRRPWQHLSVFALVVSAASCAVAVQYAVKLMVDAMSVAGRPHSDAWWALALFAALIGLESILWRLGGWIGSLTIVADGVDARLALFDHLSGHSSSFFSRQLTGALGSRITATAGATGAILMLLIWSIAPPATDFLGALVVLMTVDWRLAAGLAVVVLLVIGGLVRLGARGQPIHRTYAGEAAAIGGELIDTVANLGLVRAFAARRRELSRLSEKFTVEAKAQRKSMLFLERVRVVHDACLWVTATGMLVWVVSMWSTGQVTPGDVIMVSALTFRILHGSRDLSLAVATLAQHAGMIGETLRVIAAPHDILDQHGAAPLRAQQGRVTIDRVSFGYYAGVPVLENLSLDIAAGQSVGLVGTSGAGKSTLLHLLQRHADTGKGRILIDGQDIRTVAQDTLRRAIAVVPQDVSLFHRSVLDNIRYGRPEASEAEVIAAAAAARCHEFIEILPDGYATLVGERGVHFSGGQRQRLAIARAILKDAPIVLLDEATSALDSETERAVQEALIELGRGRTVLAVAHRLSTVARHDRIVVLDRGQVIEDGKFEQLRRRGGVFDAMWRLQVDAFDDLETTSAMARDEAA